MEKFEYILNRSEPPKLCFGSMSERKILPFNRSGQYSDSYGPENLKTVLFKIIFKFTILILNFQIYKGSFSKASRFVKNKPKYESIFYNLPKIEIKPKINLFKQTGRDDKLNQNVVPGVGTYKIFQRKPNSIHSFGGRIKKSSAIHTICKYQDQSCCQRCMQKPILAEYFRNFVNGKDFCKKCMKNEILSARKRKERVSLLMELEKYEKVRYCGFYHDHHNTTAKIKLLPEIQVIKKIRRENYLSIFHY